MNANKHYQELNYKKTGRSIRTNCKNQNQKNQIKKNKAMKLTKNEMIEKLNNGCILVENYCRMYGKYYFINDIDGKTYYNLNKKYIASIIKMCNKKMIDVNTFEFSFAK